MRAAANEQDAAIYLTAALTGLRMGELRALCWRNVEFVAQSCVSGRATPADSDDAEVREGAGSPAGAGRCDRTGPPGPARALDGRRRPGVPGELGGFLDGSALAAATRRPGAAGLRSLRFHDLRHTFGTRMIAKADIRRVQEWMGHADVQTTMGYLHYAPRDEDAALVAEVFRTQPIAERTAPS